MSNCIFQKNQNESLQLEEAQARFELKELKKTLEEELDRREKEHEEQIQLLEKVIIKELKEIIPKIFPTSCTCPLKAE